MASLTLTEILVHGLAVWRVASLFVNEAGPFSIFLKIREYFGIKHYDNGLVAVIPDTFFAQLLSCVWCASLWVGIFFTLFYLYDPNLSLKIAMVFSFSTIAILIETQVKK